MTMSGRSKASRDGRVLHPALRRRYENWLQGQEDRRSGRGCLSTNGTYLDGWYNPKQDVPDFLTPQEAYAYRRAIRETQQ